MERKDFSMFENANNVLIFNYILNFSSSGEFQPPSLGLFLYYTASLWYLMNIVT